MQERTYAKSKDKGKKGGKNQKVHVTDEELAEIVNIHKYKQDLKYIYEDLKEDFIQNLSVRTSLGGLEDILVDFDGSKHPLNELAQIIRKSPTFVVVSVTDFPQATSDIKRAIISSGMNMNPQQDGTTIYLQVPKVTKAHRESLAHSAKLIVDKTKEKIRDVQNKYVKKVKAKEEVFSEDLIRDGQLKLREIASNAVSETESLLKAKQSELLKQPNK